MTLLAGHVRPHVRFVTEPHEARKRVYLHPADGNAIFPVARELLDFRMLAQRDLMASHTPLD